MFPQKYIREDLYRYVGRWSWRLFLRYFLFTPGFRYTCIWRWTRSSRRISRPLWRLLLRHYQIKYGFQIPYQTTVGRGFYIGHFGPIIIHPAASIGHNFNVAPGVTIGYSTAAYGQEGGGVPRIGNNVKIGPNAVVVGNIAIGDNCLIAPGAFVNKDMPDDTIAIGNPAIYHYRLNASASLVGNKIHYFE